MATYARFFKSERDEAVMSRLEGKVSFPERGWAPKPGETYEVEIIGQSRSGKAQFLRKVAGPFYSVEGGQRQYGWYNTVALGKPDVEFQSGFSMGSSYYTAIWTSFDYAEALSRVDEVRRRDQEAQAEKGRKVEEESRRREEVIAAFHLRRAEEPEISALAAEIVAHDERVFGGDFVVSFEASYHGLSIKVTRPGQRGLYSFAYLKSYSNCLMGEWDGKKYRFPHTWPPYDES